MIPQYLQRKQFNNEQTDQRKVRETAGLNDFKTETYSKGLYVSANKQEEKAKQRDNEIATLFKDRSSPAAAK